MLVARVNLFGISWAAQLAHSAPQTGTVAGSASWLTQMICVDFGTIYGRHVLSKCNLTSGHFSVHSRFDFDPNLSTIFPSLFYCFRYLMIVCECAAQRQVLRSIEPTQKPKKGNRFFSRIYHSDMRGVQQITFWWKWFAWWHYYTNSLQPLCLSRSQSTRNYIWLF